MEKTAVRIQGRESVAMTTAEFGRLFATWRARFEAIACRYVRSAAVAEDLVSDSFMSFWENRGRIPADANLQAYILIIVRNKCLDWLRAQSLHAKIEQEVYELRRRVLAADIRSLQAFNPEEIFSAEVAAIVRQSLDKSLADLGTDYIDLVLIHWPVQGHIEETWQILEEYVDKGKIRSIGVSNFNPHHLDELLEYARIRPVVNQIEIEPYMTQHDVVGYTFRKGIQVEAWGPLGQGVTGVLDDPAIGEIAARHGKSAAQVILRWHMQRGLVTIPRCDNDAYTDENIRIFDFELSPSEMEIITGLNRNQRANEKNDPDNFPW